MENNAKWEKDARKRQIFSLILAVGLHLAFAYYIIQSSDVSFDFFGKEKIEQTDKA